MTISKLKIFAACYFEVCTTPMSFIKNFIYPVLLAILIILSTSGYVTAQNAFRVVPSEEMSRDKPTSEQAKRPAERPNKSPSAPRVDAPDTVLTVADVDAKIAEVAAGTGLDEAALSSAKESLQQAKLNLQSADKFKAQTAADVSGVQAAAENLENAKADLDRKPNLLDPPTGGSLADVKLQYDGVEADLGKARDQLLNFSGETSRRQGRLREIPDQQVQAEQELKKLETQYAQLNDSEDPPLVVDARRMKLISQKQNLKQELAAYEAEQKFYAATSELLPIQQELAQRKVERLEKESSKLKQFVDAKRESEIDKLARSVKEQLDATPAAIQPEAELNIELVDQYVDDSKRLAEVGSKSQRTKKMLEEIATDYKTAVERVDAVGLNATLGLMFRRSKSALVVKRREFQPDGSLQNQIQDLQIQMFSLQDLSKQASETDSSIKAIFDHNAIPEDQRKSLHDDVVDILAQRRTVLSQLTQTKTDLFNRLVALDVDQRKAVQQIDVYTDYINEHVLWIRSSSTIGESDIKSLGKAVSWVALPANWQALGGAYVSALRDRVGRFVVVISLFLLSLVLKRKLRISTETAGKKAEVGSCREFWPTAVALINTLIMSALWPAMLFGVGWLISDINNQPFVHAVAKSLMTVSFVMYPIEVLKQVCRNSGLGQSHFGWAESSRKFIRANLRVVVCTIPVLLFFIVLLQYQPTEEFRSSLGRVLMAVLLLVLFVFSFRILHPRSQLYRGIAEDDRDDFLYRLRLGSFVAVVVMFAGLMGFTLCGYYYTTYQLGSRMLQTAALLIGVALAYGTLLRWLTVRRRKMKIDMLAARREEAKRMQAADASAGEGVALSASSEPGIDANVVSKQAQELLLAVLGVIGFWISWQIWADVIPAVGILNRVNIWSVSIDGVPTPVTLQDVLNFVIATAVTVIAVKNLPGILELLLLKRLPMDSGARYAVATIVRYVLTVVGAIIAFAFLKIQWGQFSWLIAAISVGLGFGLQEIVANFVSGLILLLERPVRIGDVVTIEGTTGIVTRIQMRATTVTNWDQQELVVPNKNLITSSIFNWTLSNVLTRITLEFGVAYGTDPQFVREIIMETVKANPVVLSDPAPSVVFQTFGDSSLNFAVRCCVSGPDKRLSTIHDLQVAINQRLLEHQIEIPFPQRVMHTVNAEAPQQSPADPVGAKSGA